MTRPDDPRPAMTGKSTQNTRVERQWRDYNRLVVARFKPRFLDMMTAGILCDRQGGAVAWELDRYCLSRVFLHRIQDAAWSYANSMNSHKLSSERGRTPMQMMQDGVQQLQSAGEAPIAPADAQISPAEAQIAPGEDDENYACEWEPREEDSDDRENPNQAIVEGLTTPAGLPREWLEELAAIHGADTGNDDDARAAYEGMRRDIRRALGWGREEED